MPNTLSSSSSRSSRLLSLPVAIVVATIILCATGLTIYLVERSREADIRRRATYLAWALRFDKLESNIAEYRKIVEGEAAEAKRDGRNVDSSMIKLYTESLAVFSQSLKSLEDSRPPIPE